jgi:8-oxo-dGTP pyrophosphatase MutT (NUDIX family)
VHTESAGQSEPEIRTLRSSVLYTDPWIRLRKDDIERRDGARGTYAVVERDDSVLIIPAENGGFHLVEEYRYPVGQRSWSFPQGGFPQGETGTSEELARLELAQETGLRAGTLTRLGTLTAAHGLTTQRCDYFLATVLMPGPPDPEPEELGIEQAWFARDEFEEMTRDGRIADDSTLAAYALLLIAERRGELR